MAETQVLRLLVWEGYAPVSQRHQFERYILKKYNVRLRLDVNHIAEVEDCYRALRLKTADVISPSHNHINDKRFRIFDLGLVLPLNLENIPNYADLKSNFKGLSHLIHQGETYGAPLAWGPYGLIYNADRITVPPTSWAVLWEPRYRDLYTIANLGEHNVYITALGLGYDEEDLKHFDTFNNARFRNRLATLARYSDNFWEGVDSADNMDNMLLATSWGFSLSALRERGDDWRWAPLKEKTPSWIDNYVISHTLENRPQLKLIAEEWINFSLSPEFQAVVLVEELSARAVNAKTQEFLSPELAKMVSLDNDVLSSDMFILMPELGRRTRNGFNFLWARALKQRTDWLMQDAQ